MRKVGCTTKNCNSNVRTYQRSHSRFKLSRLNTDYNIGPNLKPRPTIINNIKLCRQSQKPLRNVWFSNENHEERKQDENYLQKQKIK